MNTAVWIAQGLLAALMLTAGFMKLSKSKEELLASGQGMQWTEDFSPSQINGIGTLESLAAIGLIVPAALDIAPGLTALAASGVVLLMLGAAATHVKRDELQVVPINAAIAAVALFVAIERFGPQAF
jgi:uncharacterized membrane protein YphA (DoxX/SURF4 family)